MGHAARQLADCLHFLRLPELLLKQLDLGDVVGYFGRPGYMARLNLDSRCGQRYGDQRAVLSLSHSVESRNSLTFLGCCHDLVVFFVFVRRMETYDAMADHFLSRIAVQSFGSVVPANHDAVES